MSKFHILCIRSDRIGDMLVSTPVIHRLRVLYPEAVLDVIASPLGAVALEDNPDVDHVFVYDKKSLRSWLGLLPVLLTPHDLVVSFNARSRTLRALTALARGKRKGALNTGKLAPWSGSPEETVGTFTAPARCCGDEVQVTKASQVFRKAAVYWRDFCPMKVCSRGCSMPR